MDVREGGAFHIGMGGPVGNFVYAIGEYRWIAPPEKLVFNWPWKGDDVPEMVADVEFRNVAGSTEVVPNHVGLPARSPRRPRGWLVGDYG